MGDTSDQQPESSYLELAYSSIKIFADDGTVDLSELSFLLGLALRDGQIDDDEKRVLRRIFDHAESTDLGVATRARIRQVRRQHGID